MRRLIMLLVLAVLVAGTRGADASPYAGASEARVFAGGSSAPTVTGVSVRAGTRSSIGRPYLCVEGSRTTEQDDRKLSVWEQGCTDSTYPHGDAAYTFDPVAWRATAAARVPTILSTSIYERRDGVWRYVGTTTVFSAAEVEVEWHTPSRTYLQAGASTYVCYRGLPSPPICAYAVASGPAVFTAAHGTISFEGLAEVATVSTDDLGHLVWCPAGCNRGGRV